MRHINGLDTINEEELKQEGMERCRDYCNDFCFDHGYGYCPNCAYYKVIQEKQNERRKTKQVS